MVNFSAEVFRLLYGAEKQDFFLRYDVMILVAGQQSSEGLHLVPIHYILYSAQEPPQKQISRLFFGGATDCFSERSKKKSG